MRGRPLAGTAALARRQVLEADRSQAILAAARRVIAAKGFAATTMDEIAEAAGLAKGTIYLYFKNKQVLFQAVVSEVLARLVAGLRELAGQQASAENRLRQMLRLLVTTLEAEEAFFRVFSTEFPILHFYLENEAAPVRELDQQLTLTVAEVIRQGIITGEFREGEARQLAHILRGMVRALALQKLVEGQPASLLEALPLLYQLVFTGLRRQPQLPAEGKA